MSTRVSSSIGESNFTNPSGKSFVVQDESLERSQRVPTRAQAINPSAVAEMRKQAMEQSQQAESRALVEAKRRVEIITGLGRKTKDVLIETDEGNLTFTLRTLKSFEQNCLAQVVESVERVKLPTGGFSFTPTGMYKIKTEALSHSLHLIDGQSIDIVLGTANMDYSEQVLARKELVCEMDGALVDHLFIQYEVLSSEARDGYEPKNEEEVKEVVDTIRKSGQDA